MGGRWKHLEWIRETLATEVFGVSHLPSAAWQAMSKGGDDRYEDSRGGGTDVLGAPHGKED